MQTRQHQAVERPQRSGGGASFGSAMDMPDNSAMIAYLQANQVDSDGLGFNRGSGARDRDLYAPRATSAAAFLATPGAGGAYEATGPAAVKGLGDRKKLWVEAIKRAGGTRDESAVMLAQLMQENFTGTGYDATKDGNTDGSRNFSNLNLNADMLFNFGALGETFSGDLKRLNEDDGMVHIARAALNVMRKLGVDRYLHLTRGGRSGMDKPSEDDRKFASSIREVAGVLANDDEASTSDHRLAHRIHHR